MVGLDGMGSVFVLKYFEERECLLLFLGGKKGKKRNFFGIYLYRKFLYFLLWKY